MSSCSRSFDQAVAAIHSKGFRGDGVSIGHLDTGVDASHRALRGKVAEFRDFSRNGMTSTPCDPHDSGSHGTQTASLLVGNGFGAAPAATLRSGNVIEDGFIVARILLGLDWLAGTDVSVVNLSIGCPSDPAAFNTVLQVLQRKNVVVTAPIGNLGAGRHLTPGACLNVISVGSSDDAGKVEAFSGSLNDPNSGAVIKPDIVAPGLDVPVLTAGCKRTTQTGSSFSCAALAGVVACLRGAFPNATAPELVTAVYGSCQPLLPDQSHRSRYGMIRPLAAFETLRAGGLAHGMPHVPAQSKWTDPRLSQQIDDAGGTDTKHAILEFTDETARASFVKHASRDISAMTLFRHWPAGVFRCTAACLRSALQCSNVTMASACDVDRGDYF